MWLVACIFLWIELEFLWQFWVHLLIRHLRHKFISSSFNLKGIDPKLCELRPKNVIKSDFNGKREWYETNIGYLTYHFMVDRKNTAPQSPFAWCHLSLKLTSYFKVLIYNNSTKKCGDAGWEIGLPKKSKFCTFTVIDDYALSIDLN